MAKEKIIELTKELCALSEEDLLIVKFNVDLWKLQNG